MSEHLGAPLKKQYEVYEQNTENILKTIMKEEKFIVSYIFKCDKNDHIKRRKFMTKK